MFSRPRRRILRPTSQLNSLAILSYNSLSLSQCASLCVSLNVHDVSLHAAHDWSMVILHYMIPSNTVSRNVLRPLIHNSATPEMTAVCICLTMITSAKTALDFTSIG